MPSSKNSDVRLTMILSAAFLAVAFWCWFSAPRSKTPAPVGVAESADAGPPSPEPLKMIASADVVDFPRLMRQLLEGSDGGEQVVPMIASLMRRWLKEDPESFAAFLDEAEVEGLDLWDRLAPGMMAALREMKDEISDQDLLGRVLERVLLKAAETDPVSALAWAREQLTGPALDATLAGIAVEMAGRDPTAAIKLLDDITIFPNQMQAATGVGVVLGRSGYPLALTWAESFFSETERSFALSGVLSGMAGQDTARAASEYRRIVDAMKAQYREQVLADRAVSGGTIDEEYEGLSPEEIEKAELAKPNPNLIYLESATRAIALELARRNPKTALDWARSMDVYQGKAAALEVIYEQWGASDPGAAFAALKSEADRRPDLAAKLFESWAAHDANPASVAALALPQGLERDFAIEGVARGWSEAGTDPARIAEWGEQLRSNSEADRVRAVVASAAAYEHPVLAWRQVERITNPLKRSELFQEVFPSLVEEDPQLARTALSTIQLSAVEIEYFEDMLQP